MPDGATSPYYARKGETVTCENGHGIATFRADAVKWAKVSADIFDWHIPNPPKDYDPIPVCPDCGAPAFRYMGGVCHFADGWR